MSNILYIYIDIESFKFNLYINGGNMNIDLDDFLKHINSVAEECKTGDSTDQIIVPLNFDVSTDDFELSAIET